MILVKTIAALNDALQSGAEDAVTGLVPTMGALHPGHISLIEEAKKTSDFVMVTIFVNPTQFNDPADLERYPRDLERDMELLKESGADLVFAPSVKEIYPEKDERKFDLSPLDQVMEGKFRPGHFNGVAQVVSRLFSITRPNKAYFGLKDYQQLAIIRKMAQLEGFQIEIIGCPIIREADGLAMSSRNQLLTLEERNLSPRIFETLKMATGMKPAQTPVEIMEWVVERINGYSPMEVEYFEIVDGTTLERIVEWGSGPRDVGCIAVYLGKVRLIDNIYFD